MARVAEIASGVQYQFSAEENSIAASTTRVFRILKAEAAEYINIAVACGVSVGQQHPTEHGLYCHSYSAQYEGDSRMVIQATFNYKATAATAGQASSDPQRDRNETPPDTRPANWSISTSLQEFPAYLWRPITGNNAGNVVATVNSAGDPYEGITRLEPIITISVEQFEAVDPTRHSKLAGRVNSNSFLLGSLDVFPRSLMFRGVQAQPAVERWGDFTFRGWKASYEFAYRSNFVKAPINTEIGWDITVPQVGHNVVCFAPPGNAEQDPFGQPLRWDDDGSIKAPLALAQNVAPGSKFPAMVRILGRNTDGKPINIQTRASLPVPLNNDGTARSRTAPGGPVLVHRYQVYADIDFTTFGLRLT